MKEKQMCAIVEDLFSSYTEELTNETTSHKIEEHLKKCKSCQKKYEVYLLQTEEENMQDEKKGWKFYRRLSRYRYQLTGVILGIVFTLAVIIGGTAFSIFYLQKAATINNYTENIEEYGEFQDYAGISKLYLFPSKKKMDMKNISLEKYVYECYGNKMFQTCQIYLECKYSKESYLAEKERLKNVKGEEKAVQNSEADFAYPGVYAMLNSESCYEYALFLEEEQKIIYVYIQGLVDRRELKFSEKYLPLEYGQNGDSFENEKEYNIYSIDMEEVTG